MKYELIKMADLRLFGYIFYGDPFTTKPGWDGENEIGKTTVRFIEFLRKNDSEFDMDGEFVYEVHVYNEHTKETGIFEVFAGAPAIGDYKSYDLSAKYFIACDYVLFTLTGKEIMGDWWLTIDTEILPQLKLKRNHSFIIQRYDSRFKSIERIDESEMEVLIPVEVLDHD